ncbi:MAG: hypothetical protein IT368_16110 [Candidatus Hydrogenedentes bacterium]|nr:hypothetical protein [Candidatus Hydrogenedentota bacterium]
MWSPVIAFSLVLFHAFAAAAEEAPALGYLNWVREQIAFVTAEAQAPEEAPGAPPATWAEWLHTALGTEGGMSPEEAGRMEGEILLLRQEVADLKESMRQLQDTFDVYMGRMLAQAQQENEALRQEVRRLYALAGGESALPPAVPRPDGDVLDQVLQHMAAEAPLNVPPEVIDQTAPLPQSAVTAASSLPSGDVAPLPADFAFTVISEWGRSPDQVANLPGNVASLKGIVGVVPEGSSQDQLVALGRDLRQRYAAYDNINIEVFTDPEAAQAYADRSTMSDPNARVLSVSRHQASGRDVILLLNTPGGTIEIPAQ